MSNSLKAVIANTQSKFITDPAKAKTTFISSSQLQDGFCSQVQIREHTLTVDEPKNLGGKNAGPNPVELILAALGTCQEITYRAYATALDIPLKNVSVRLEGAIDLRGFLGVDDAARSGYQAIRGVVTIESSASKKQLEQLREAVNSHCPVLDMLSQPVPVDLSLDVRHPANRS